MHAFIIGILSFQLMPQDRSYTTCTNFNSERNLFSNRKLECELPKYKTLFKASGISQIEARNAQWIHKIRSKDSKHYLSMAFDPLALFDPAKTISSAAEIGLKLKLRRHDQVKVIVSGSTAELIQGKILGACVSGRGWMSPMMLTCRYINCIVGSVQIDTSKLARGEIVLAAPVKGRCFVDFTADDFANFLCHPKVSLQYLINLCLFNFQIESTLTTFYVNVAHFQLVDHLHVHVPLLPYSSILEFFRFTLKFSSIIPFLCHLSRY